MMSLGMRKGKGWTLMEVERRRKVPRMMAVYTTGLTTPLNSVLMIRISLEQLSPGTLAANCLVGLIFI